MENDLTTGDDSLQVNSEEQVSGEVESTEEVVADTTNVQDGDAYADAWDKIDVNDDSAYEKMGNTETESEEVPTNFFNEADNETVTDTSESNGNAFMSDKPVLKYKGRDIPIDTQEELIALAQKGFSFETEMGNIKPKKKVLSIVDGIPLETLQALADIHGGNTDAISYIKSQYKIEDTQSADDNYWNNEEPASKADESKGYVPEVTHENPMDTYWNEYSAGNKQMAGKVTEMYDGLDESFKSEIYTPDIFPAFISSVSSGEFESAYPIAIKEKSLNPAMSWLQAYGTAVKKIGAKSVAQTEPPSSATPPANIGNHRDMGSGSADRVWNDEDYFQSLEDKLFG